MLPQPVAPPQPAEAELAQRFAAGDRAAFEPIMRRHNRMLFRIARSILKDDAEAEDAVQEAYVAAFRNAASFRGDAALSTWLARIVVNEAYGRLRRRRRDAVVVPFDSLQRDAETSGDDMPDDTTESPETATLRGEMRDMIERRVDELPEQFRTVFMLREVQELTVEETAACLDLPAATVRTRAFRARALLREALARDIDVATLGAFDFDGARCDRIVAHVQERLADPRADIRPSPLQD